MKINWIVLDMDGTLLNSKKELPKDFFTVKKQLEALGLKFVLASGRQYQRMRTVVAPYEDDFFYLSDNGTMVTVNNETIDETTIDQKVSVEIMDTALLHMPVQLVLNTTHGAYFPKSTDEKTIKVFEEYYEDYHLFESYDNIDHITKITFYNEEDNFENTEVLDKYRDFVNITHSGPTWLDLVSKEISKGIALTHLSKKYDVDLASVMVFGDAMNDEDMLDVAGVPIVMANADERLKSKGYTQTLSNDEDGVMVILKQLLQQGGVWDKE